MLQLLLLLGAVSGREDQEGAGLGGANLGCVLLLWKGLGWLTGGALALFAVGLYLGE